MATASRRDLFLRFLVKACSPYHSSQPQCSLGIILLTEAHKLTCKEGRKVDFRVLPPHDLVIFK